MPLQVLDGAHIPQRARHIIRLPAVFKRQQVLSPIHEHRLFDKKSIAEAVVLQKRVIVQEGGVRDKQRVIESFQLSRPGADPVNEGSSIWARRRSLAAPHNRDLHPVPQKLP